MFAGNYFASHFIMGGEKFDSTHPEGYLFGENTDLNFLGTRPVAVGSLSANGCIQDLLMEFSITSVEMKNFLMNDLCLHNEIKKTTTTNHSIRTKICYK